MKSHAATCWRAGGPALIGGDRPVRGLMNALVIVGPSANAVLTFPNASVVSRRVPWLRACLFARTVESDGPADALWDTRGPGAQSLSDGLRAVTHRGRVERRDRVTPGHHAPARSGLRAQSGERSAANRAP